MAFYTFKMFRYDNLMFDMSFDRISKFFHTVVHPRAYFILESSIRIFFPFSMLIERRWCNGVIMFGVFLSNKAAHDMKTWLVAGVDLFITTCYSSWCIGEWNKDDIPVQYGTKRRENGYLHTSSSCSFPSTKKGGLSCSIERRSDQFITPLFMLPSFTPFIPIFSCTFAFIFCLVFKYSFTV